MKKLAHESQSQGALDTNHLIIIKLAFASEVQGFITSSLHEEHEETLTRKNLQMDLARLTLAPRTSSQKIASYNFHLFECKVPV